MATHCLVQGGIRTVNADYNMFPTVLPGVDQVYKAEVRTPAVHSLARVLDFASGMMVTNPNVPAAISPEAWGSTGLVNFLKNNTVAANDVLQICVLPRRTMLTHVYLRVAKPITPCAFTLRVAGRSSNLGSPIVLGTGISGAATTEMLIDVAAHNSGNPVWFKQNDVLELIPTSMPAVTVGSDGQNAGGLMGLGLVIAPIVFEFEKGAF